MEGGQADARGEEVARVGEAREREGDGEEGDDAGEGKEHLGGGVCGPHAVAEVCGAVCGEVEVEGDQLVDGGGVGGVLEQREEDRAAEGEFGGRGGRCWDGEQGAREGAPEGRGDVEDVGGREEEGERAEDVQRQGGGGEGGECRGGDAVHRRRQRDVAPVRLTGEEGDGGGKEFHGANKAREMNLEQRVGFDGGSGQTSSLFLGRTVRCPPARSITSP